MSSLQEILTLLLGAEGEARRKIEETRAEAENILTRTRQEFQREREDRMTSVRGQVQALIESADSAATTEARQILAMARQETLSMTERFQIHSRDVVETLADETAIRYVRKGTR